MCGDRRCRPRSNSSFGLLSMGACGQRSAASVMVFIKMRLVCSVISRTRPPTTCWPPAFSPMRSGTDCCLGWGCSTWPRLISLCLVDWWQNMRSTIPKHFKRSFNSLVLLVSWMVWKERNQRTFDRITRTSSQLIALILEEADAWVAAGFRCNTLGVRVA